MGFGGWWNPGGFLKGSGESELTYIVTKKTLGGGKKGGS